MSAITAAAVKELREITGVAMMDCKKALVECNGDLEEAKEFLRKKGQAKALKKSSRETREGAVEIRVDENHRSGAIIKLCLLYTSPSPRDATLSRMPSSA